MTITDSGCANNEDWPPTRVPDPTPHIVTSGIAIAKYCVAFSANGEAQISALISDDGDEGVTLQPQDTTTKEAQHLRKEFLDFIVSRGLDPTQVHLICVLE